MSGGHFYNQWIIDDIAGEIEELIRRNNSTEKDEFGYDLSYHFSDNTIDRFKETVKLLEKASVMVNRIDYLVCADDSEETFHKILEEDIRGLGGTK